MFFQQSTKLIMTHTDTPCVITSYAVDTGGYVRVKLNGKHVLKHRLAYCVANGVTLDSIKGKVVMHKCDNPSCVNPEHLVLGTQQENVQDMLNKGRDNRTNNLKGSKHNMAKLTEELVKEIKVQLAAGKYSVDISVTFNVSAATVSYIKSGKIWKHVK